jgi:hypothetical protein
MMRMSDFLGQSADISRTAYIPPKPSGGREYSSWYRNVAWRLPINIDVCSYWNLNATVICQAKSYYPDDEYQT